MLVQTWKTACPSSWHCSGNIWNNVRKMVYPIFVLPCATFN